MRNLKKKIEKMFLKNWWFFFGFFSINSLNGSHGQVLIPKCIWVTFLEFIAHLWVGIFYGLRGERNYDYELSKINLGNPENLFARHFFQPAFLVSHCMHDIHRIFSTHSTKIHYPLAFQNCFKVSRKAAISAHSDRCFENMSRIAWVFILLKTASAIPV